MEQTDRKTHWENVYQNKKLPEVSWYQPVPQTSLDFITEAKIAKDAAIIDIGGGDSYLVDHLLELGYTNITVLDISVRAIERAKGRLGDKASSVKWVVSDILEFKPETIYELWHDRATFHFLTESKDIEQYVELVNRNIKTGGTLILGTFAEDGPKKCSGLDITQYSQEGLKNLVKANFDSVKCISTVHPTPFDTVQRFTFCSFTKI